MDPDKIETVNLNPLSAAAVALLDQMPTADRKILDEALAAMAMSKASPAAGGATGAGAGETSGITPAADPFGAGGELVDDAAAVGALTAGGTPEANAQDEAATVAGSNTTMDEAAVKNMIDAAMKPVLDGLAALKPAGAAGAAGRLDAAANNALAGLDMKEVLRQSAEAATKAVGQRMDALGALVQRARTDGHDVHTPTAAAAAMIADCDKYLAPPLATRFKTEMAAGRLDAAAYDQAQVLKKAEEDRLRQEMEATVGIGGGSGYGRTSNGAGDRHDSTPGTRNVGAVGGGGGLPPNIHTVRRPPRAQQA